MIVECPPAFRSLRGTLERRRTQSAPTLARGVGARATREPGVITGYAAVWYRPGDANPLVRGVNHINPTAREPAGSNEGYLDGHAEWVNARRFVAKPKLDFGGLQLFFYAGVPASR